MCLHNIISVSLCLLREKEEKLIMVEAGIYQTPHSLTHPYLPIVRGMDILQRNSAVALGFQRNMVIPREDPQR